MDVSSFSIEELREHIQALTDELKRREDQERQAFFDQIKTKAAELGISSDDVQRLFSGGGRQKTASPPKYRNPSNADQTWTGRGRKPGWVAAHLDGGGSLEDLAI